MIKITCPREGFWRAGVRHPKGTAEYEDKDFSGEQLELLCAEPMLTVVVEEEEAPPDDPFADPVDLPPGPAAPPEEDKPVNTEPLAKLDRLVNAISTLPIDDQSLWTKSGKPQVPALGKAAGEDVSAVERDEAWTAWQNRAEQ